MSHSNRALTNKHQKYSKIGFQQYLYSSREPDDDIGHDDDKAKLQEHGDKYYTFIRRDIRRYALRLRMS